MALVPIAPYSPEDDGRVAGDLRTDELRQDANAMALLPTNMIRLPSVSLRRRTICVSSP